MRDAWVLLLAALAVSSTTSTVEAQDSDDYTRYELLAPETAQFRIVYEVTATTPGAAVYFNPIRKGSEASDEAVYDRASGKPLRFEVVDGASARATGDAERRSRHALHQGRAAAPGPDRRRARLRIDKTYQDPKSYFTRGRRDRVLALARHQEERGRAASGLRARGVQRAVAGSAGAGRPHQGELHERGARRGLGRRQGAGGCRAASALSAAAVPILPPPRPAGAATAERRAPRGSPSALTRTARSSTSCSRPRPTPSTSTTTTPRRAGRRSLPERRARGQHASRPEGGRARHRRGAAARDAQGRGDPQGRDRHRRAGRAESEVVVIRFPKVAAGQTLRLRISETYTDAARYRLDGDELVFDRSFGRPRNAVVLPAGYYAHELLDPGRRCPRRRTAASGSTSSTRGPTRSRC